MGIVLAKSAGFCFGVKRAVEIVENQIKQRPDKKIYTYGPIIHNEIVVSEFEANGVSVIEEDSDLSQIEPGIVIIRSHGVSKKVIDKLEKYGFEIVDATCPFVLKIHKLVQEFDEEGLHIIIVGNETHPEVEGIIGWIPSGRYHCISSVDDFLKLNISLDEKIGIVSQTTFNYDKFQELVEIIRQKGYDICAKNTICSATEERQKEAVEISKNVDAMIVIGGKSSSNSRKLYEICKANCENTYFIQTDSDLDLSVLQSIDDVGITAGASTPKKIIEEVQKKCQK
ncbi:MAG: 4-hydroxy-3-methylbut-2-enyl diphosphate reductase [Lachnospiraceae bacterium]|nr:4-hydroxy-3-methylbut-2-enyl diphosphate reductase [Lachnospiraceae bacterium]